ncbi:MAG: hypothetical protein FWB95_06605 [Treponema sp.]|nr:hypothetical protein [Treponema sp.]
MAKTALKTMITLFIISLSSCDAVEIFYSVSIINKSAKIVSFSYAGIDAVLAPDQERLFEGGGYAPGTLLDVIDENGIASLDIDYVYAKSYTFTDAQPFNLNVVNSLPISIKMKAGNFIDNEGLMELEIEAKETSNAKIYTNKPDFTLIDDSENSSYPVIFDWNYNKETETVNVIIR